MNIDDLSFRPLGSALQQADAALAKPLPHKRLALVTGGHRRLGGAISAALARAGYVLAIHGSHDTRLDSYLALTLEEEKTEWFGFTADFSDPDAAEALVGEVAAHFKRPPDILINCAAMFGQDDLATVTGDDLMRHYAINCVAPTLLTKAFAMIPAGAVDRCIINILDQRLDHPHPDQLAYTLSKFGLAGLTRVTSASLAPKVRVNAVSPGLTLSTDDYDDAQMQRLAELMPLQCLPEADQIVQAILYLIDATAVTGQTLYVDGGAHMVGYERDFMHLCKE